MSDPALPAEPGNGRSPERIFLGLAVIFLLAYNITTPPFQAPDEFNHFYRTWQIAEGQWLPEKQDSRVGGFIPYDVTDFTLPFRLTSTTEHKVSLMEMSAMLKQESAAGPRTFVDFPNTAYYSPVSYLPQAFAVFITVRSGGSPLLAYYMGRLILQLAWLFCMYWSVKMMPVYKWLFMLLLLLPMQLYLATSLSADVVTNLLAFFFIAMVMKMAHDGTKVSRRHLWLLAMLCILLSLSKIVYSGLLLMLFIIPREAFGSARVKWLTVLPLLIVSALAAYLWSETVMAFYLPEADYNPAWREAATLGHGADYHRQLHLVLNDPGYFVRVVFNSLFSPTLPYYKGYIGQFGAFLGLTLPVWCYALSFAAILAIAFAEGKAWRPRRGTVAVVLASVVLSTLLLLLSQHLTWDEVGSGKVWLLQGRYFIPLFPPLFMLLGLMPAAPRLPYRLLVVVLVLFLNAYSAGMLYQRYIREPYMMIEDYSCGAERLDPAGHFVSDDGRRAFSGQSVQFAGDARTGRYSALSSQQHPFIFELPFDSVSAGDLFEIEVWKKREGAALVVAGGGARCGDFWIANTKPGYRDRHGWEHIHMAYKLPPGCLCARVSFVIHNASADTVVFDDLRIRLRRKQKSL